MERFAQRLNQIGFLGLRRAVAALVLSLFMSFFILLAVLLFQNGLPEWVAPFLALAACYGVAFMGVAAEWFWGRWFAAGLGWSGLMIACVPMLMSGEWSPVLGIYGGLHGLVVLALAGTKMAERYDLQPSWRERFGMDEFGVARLRKTVTRASASLPSVILWALAPKDQGQGVLLTIASVGAGALAVGGLAGIIRGRSWGLLGLGAAGALLVPFASSWGIEKSGLASFSVGHAAFGWAVGLAPASSSVATTLACALLLVAVAPFAGPIARHLGRHSV
jgi:hypothetical protein